MNSVLKKTVSALAVVAMLGVPLTLTGCDLPQVLSSLSATVNSPSGQSLVTNVIDTAFPSLEAIIAKGAAATAADAATVAYWCPWMQLFVTTFGPQIPGFTASALAQATTDIANLQAAANAVTATSPTIGGVVAALSQVVNDLAPVVAAVK